MKEPKPNRVMVPAAVETVPGKPVQRWSAARKRDVVLRLLRGESIDTVSRQIGIEPFRLEQWRERALAAPLAAVIGRRVRLARSGRELKGCCPIGANLSARPPQ